MNDLTTITLAGLETLEAEGILQRTGLGTLRSELERQRRQREHDERLASELATARELLIEYRKQAAVDVVTLPFDGTDADAVVVSLSGEVLAREEVEGQIREYRMVPGKGLAFVDGDVWPRIEADVLAALDSAHRRYGTSSQFVVIPPHGARSDLVRLFQPTTHLTAGAKRGEQLAALAQWLPLEAPIVRRWAESAVDSPETDAAPFVRILAQRFAAVGEPLLAVATSPRAPVRAR